MQDDLRLALKEDVFQVIDQFDQRLGLGVRRCVFLKIANQANPDGIAVVLVVFDMATMDLVGPTLGDFDLADSGVGSIADHKVVGQSVFHFPGRAVIKVKDGGIAFGGGTVVDDDVCPAILL